MERLGQPEVNYLGDGAAFHLFRQDVRRFHVTVDGLAAWDEKFEALPEREIPLLAVARHGRTVDELHDKVGQPLRGRSGIQHPGEVGLASNRTTSARSVSSLAQACDR